MKLLIEDDEIIEKPILVESNDRGLVIRDRTGERGEGKDELTKEIIANDALIFGPSSAAKIHGVPASSASKYKDGLDLKEDTRSRVLDRKSGIADSAVNKLLESLELFNPSDIEKPLDQVRAAQSLATIVEKMTPNSKQGENEIHLHLYAPKQRPLKEYAVIDV